MIVNRSLLKIFFIAFFIRFIFLLTLVIFSKSIDPYLFIDDVNYERFAIIYAQNASKTIDINAYKISSIALGGVETSQLYFFLLGIVFKIFNSVFILRVMNIFIAALTIFPIYTLSKELFNDNVAKKASLLYSLLPYYVMFSGFLFKDTLLMLLLVVIIKDVIIYYKYNKINFKKILLFIVMLYFLRKIVVYFVIPLIIFAIYLVLKKNYNKMSNKILTISVISMFIISIYFIDLRTLINYANIYFSYNRDYQGLISIVRIDNLYQLYKLPFVWVLSLMFPLNFSGDYKSWYGIMSFLNNISLFLLPAYFMFFLTKKTAEQKLFFYPMLFLHLSIITLVFNVPRHYYFIHFYYIISSAGYLNKHWKTLHYILMVIIIWIISVILYYIGLKI